MYKLQLKCSLMIILTVGMLWVHFICLVLRFEMAVFHDWITYHKNWSSLVFSQKINKNKK